MPTRPPRHRRATVAGRRLRPRLEAFEDRTLLASAFTVTALTDTGAGSGMQGDLRYCLTQADLAGGSIIDFAVGGTIQLQSALPDLSKDVTIAGPGAAGLTIAGGGPSSNFSVLDIDAGVNATITGLTLANGHATVGGGINNAGSLTLVNSTISGSSATSGGGLYNAAAGTLTLVDSTLSGDTATGRGGGLNNKGTATLIQTTVDGVATARSGGGVANYGTLMVADSTFTDNQSASNGGAILNSGGIATITGSTFRGNTAGYGGGAVDNELDLTETIIGTMTIAGSTFVANACGLTIPAYGYYTGGAVANNAVLTITGSAFTGNSATTGGALANTMATADGVTGIPGTGRMTVAGSTFTANSATLAGGAIYNGSGTLTMANSTLSGNSAARFGGAVYIYGGATTIAGSTLVGNSVLSGAGGAVGGQGAIAVTNSTVSGNSARYGGGLESYGGSLTITGSTVSHNSAYEGGGFASYHGSLTITGSTVASNTASYAGGIFALAGTCSINGSTVASNTAAVSGAGVLIDRGSLTATDSTLSGNSTSGSGGGLYNYDGAATIADSTIADNEADGGGISTSDATTTLVNTIVARNLAADGTTPSDLSGAVDPASRNNLIGTGGSGGLTNETNGNLVGVANPGLGTLGNYGGPTETIPLLPGSPALDAGSNADVTTAIDQRGFARITNGTVDIGAFESRGFTVSVVPGSTPQSTAVGTAFPSRLAVVVSSPYGEPVAGGTVAFGVTPAANGASAALDEGIAAIAADGSASVAATANAIAGAYVASASAGGGNPAATFQLTNTAVTVAGTVVVGWGVAGTATLQTAADGLRLLPAGRSTDLPWSGIQRLTVTLSGGATLTAADVTISSAAGVAYGSATVSGSGTSFTITLARPITSADRVTITIGGAGIAAFTRRLDVLPGDFNDDGAVTMQDAIGIRNEYLGIAGATPTLAGDINGDGVVDINDYNVTRRLVGTVLP